MKKTTPRTAQRRRTSTTTPTAIPPQLSGLLMLIHEDASSGDAEEMARALVAARRALQAALTDGQHPGNVMSDFVTSEAARGAWKPLHEAIAKLERPEYSPLNATTGDFQNVYGIPSMTLGIALAYVFLTDGGTR